MVHKLPGALQPVAFLIAAAVLQQEPRYHLLIPGAPDQLVARQCSQRPATTDTGNRSGYICFMGKF